MDAYVPMVQLMLNGVTGIFFFGNFIESYLKSRGADFNILADAYRLAVGTVLSLGAWQGISLLG
ncbi:MAG: hypothetical protein G01um101429_787 [Parcubacteria group bacterium Gr01-1014_29]|nr:MAG: hypothetical protein G01um101429_787 [Parcubacteria group bacterium Gr01-1014_29]